MMYKYVGENMIWAVRANNPYEQNHSAGVALRFFVESEKEAVNTANFFKEHIEPEYITEIDTTTSHIELTIRNSFGNLSTVYIGW